MNYIFFYAEAATAWPFACNRVLINVKELSKNDRGEGEYRWDIYDTKKGHLYEK